MVHWHAHTHTHTVSFRPDIHTHICVAVHMGTSHPNSWHLHPAGLGVRNTHTHTHTHTHTLAHCAKALLWWSSLVTSYKLQVFFLSDAQNDTGSDWALTFLRQDAAHTKALIGHHSSHLRAPAQTQLPSCPDVERERALIAGGLTVSSQLCSTRYVRATPCLHPVYLHAMLGQLLVYTQYIYTLC